jgi:DoxX-like family
MDTAYMIVTIAAALWVGFSGFSTLTRASWVVDNLADYGVPRSWWPWLGTAKAAGAIGLLVGLAVPAVGVVAALGLVLYFLAAVITVIRARLYKHVPFPLLYLLPVVAAGGLGYATL